MEDGVDDAIDTLQIHEVYDLGRPELPPEMFREVEKRQQVPADLSLASALPRDIDAASVLSSSERLPALAFDLQLGKYPAPLSVIFCDPQGQPSLAA